MSARRPPEECFGIGPGQQEIVDLHDTGMAADAIARRLRVAPDYVTRVIARYDFDSLDRVMRATEDAIRVADHAYQIALAASGGRYV